MPITIKEQHKGLISLYFEKTWINSSKTKRRKEKDEEKKKIIFSSRPESSTYRCDFEQRVICSFLENDQNNIENWKIGTGPVSDVDTGPFVDHTLGNTNGSYIFVNGTAAKTKEVKLQTVVLTDNYCVRFFYHMYGDNVGYLLTQVYSIYHSDASTYFFRSRKQDQWKAAQFSVTMDQLMKVNGYKVIFIAKYRNSSNFRGDIALDDIELKPGKCPDAKREANVLCNFDDYDCGYSQGSDSGMKWQWKSASRSPNSFPSQPSTDNTLGTRYGGYWFIGSFKAERYQFSNLKSPTYAKPKQAINCLHFYYNINANFTDWSEWTQDESLEKTYLESELFVKNKQRTILMKIKNTTELGQWHLIKTKAEITNSFYLVFDATINSRYEVVMVIDDVQMFPGDCNETDQCAGIICKNGGRCHVENQKPFCRCPTSFIGENCEIDKCSLIECENNGTCIIEGGKAVCNCMDTYTGDKCQTDKCSLITCENKARCIIEGGKAVCNCTEKFQGDKCDIDKCSFIGCENSGTCIIEGGKAVCNCTEKYQGDKCDIDKCSLITCGDNGKCIIEVGKAVCNCSANYTGEKCDIDKCSLVMCENSGKCVIEFGKPVCNCTTRYTGEKCDIDKCSLIACENNGRCIIQAGKAVCTCTAKYTGYKCDIDKCSLITCENNGICIIEAGKAACTCTAKYTGEKCDIDKCSLITCGNNGKCVIEAGKAACKCAPKYTGDKCDIDKCSLIKCENSGTCYIDDEKAVCNCTTGFSGDKCDIVSAISRQQENKSVAALGSITGILLIIILIILIMVVVFYRKLKRNPNNYVEHSDSSEIGVSVDRISVQRTEKKDMEMSLIPQI